MNLFKHFHVFLENCLQVIQTMSVIFYQVKFIFLVLKKQIYKVFFKCFQAVKYDVYRFRFFRRGWNFFVNETNLFWFLGVLFTWWGNQIKAEFVNVNVNIYVDKRTGQHTIFKYRTNGNI